MPIGPHASAIDLMALNIDSMARAMGSNAHTIKLMAHKIGSMARAMGSMAHKIRSIAHKSELMAHKITLTALEIFRAFCAENAPVAPAPAVPHFSPHTLTFAAQHLHQGDGGE